MLRTFSNHAIRSTRSLFYLMLVNAQNDAKKKELQYTQHTTECCIETNVLTFLLRFFSHSDRRKSIYCALVFASGFSPRSIFVPIYVTGLSGFYVRAIRKLGEKRGHGVEITQIFAGCSAR